MVRHLSGVAALTLLVGLSILGTEPADAQTSQSAVVAVKITIVTKPNAVTLSNIDVAGGLPFEKVKRYTVSISPMTGAPAGVDRVELLSGVLDAAGSTATQIQILALDGSDLTNGAFTGPFTGTNTFLRFTRGADGLGRVTVSINAYVELEP